MKCKWIVENFTKEPSYLELVEALNKNGNYIKEIKDGFKYSDLDEFKTEPQCVMFLGSIEMTNIVCRELVDCHPVAYCNFPNYLCSRYYSHFGKYLFNDKHALVSLKELQRQRFLYYGVFGKESLIFVRPDSGQKTFQAQLVDITDLDRFCRNNQHVEHDLILVSTPKNVRWEGRFIVSSSKEIIAHSTYRYQDEVTRIPSVPAGSLAFCKEMLEVGYYPDEVFCIDLCETEDGEFFLLELTSFSSAGLYASDKNKIVQRVSEIAEYNYHVGK